MQGLKVADPSCCSERPHHGNAGCRFHWSLDLWFTAAVDLCLINLADWTAITLTSIRSWRC